MDRERIERVAIATEALARLILAEVGKPPAEWVEHLREAWRGLTGACAVGASGDSGWLTLLARSILVLAAQPGGVQVLGRQWYVRGGTLIVRRLPE